MIYSGESSQHRGLGSHNNSVIVRNFQSGQKARVGGSDGFSPDGHQSRTAGALLTFSNTTGNRHVAKKKKKIKSKTTTIILQFSVRFSFHISLYLHDLYNEGLQSHVVLWIVNK